MSPSSWTFLTNHAIVLLCVATEPEMTLRAIGDRVGITERATHRIIGDLVAGGYLIVRKDGRRNVYRVRKGGRLRHPEARHVQIGDLLELLGGAIPAGPEV